MVMTEIADFEVVSGRTTAEGTSVDRMEQSIEDVLEKEKETHKKLAIHRYVREASYRMCLHLPIKPRDTKPSDASKFSRKTEDKPLKLPELVGSPSITSMSGKADSAVRKTNISADSQVRIHTRGQRGTQLPSIEQTKKGEKRKRKIIDSNQRKQTPLKSNLRNISEENIKDEPLQVVLCGRSPLSKDGSEGSEKRELFVSKHGRFKSR